MSVIAWRKPPLTEELPYRQRIDLTGAARGTHWPAVAQRLRARPNRWAWVATYSTWHAADVTASEIRLAKRQLGSGFDAVARTVDGEHRLYVRYVGGASS